MAAASGHVAAIGGGHPGTRGAPRSHLPPALAHEEGLEKLLAGVRRLNDEWREADAQPPPNADGTAGRHRPDFRRTVQILSRFESSFRRAPLP